MRGPTPFRKKILAVSLVVPGAMVAICAAILYLNFHPSRTYEIPGSHRLFAQAIDSADETVHVKAGDWPHTFWQPFLLGDAAWLERYRVAQFFRSKDGSVVAFFAQDLNVPEPLYVAAYDFKDHKRFDAGNAQGGEWSCNAAVIELMEQRGGREESPIEIPPLNSGLYKR